MPNVSVIIPTYNRASVIKRAIESVLAQDYRDYELIVVDDGSSDSGGRVIAGLLGGNPNCQFIRLNTNHGVSYARNTGVKHSRGTWIAFLDSDDQWFSSKLRKQILWLDANPAYRIAQTEEQWIRKGEKVNPPATHIKRAGDIFAVSLQRCMITPSSVILQRTLFDEFKGFNESLPACEDYDLWLKITARYPVGLIPEKLMIRYGGHEDQLSASVMGLDRFRIRALLDLLKGNHLDARKKRLVVDTLVKRCSIVAQGYRKRDNIELYERYRKIAATAREFGEFH
ncbi:MAG: glycosyltransferase [Chitinivibrionales bacterium]|nr:glycosyltransferase [Chitinivibrionales bacterium]MBD3357260.1 glycosyltransferase [Chitinivibrionales bacterium]